MLNYFAIRELYNVNTRTIKWLVGWEAHRAVQCGAGPFAPGVDIITARGVVNDINLQIPYVVMHLSEHRFDAVATGDLTGRAGVIDGVGCNRGEFGSVARFYSFINVAGSRKIVVITIVCIVTITGNERKTEEC